MNILSKRQTVVEVEYTLHWQSLSGRGWGPACDENGAVSTARMNETVLSIWLQFTEDGMPKREVHFDGETYRYQGVQKCVRHVTTPAVGLCECGKQVALRGFTNTCECGRDYNMSGALLAPREQWGEETGETLGEILRIR